MSGDTFLLLMRLGFSLSLVFGLMWVAGRVMKGRSPLANMRSSEQIEVLERKALSRTSSIAVVRVGEQVLALGVSDNNISVLSEVSLSEANTTVVADATPAAIGTVTSGPVAISSVPASTPAEPSRQGWLDSLRDKTVRHIPS